MRSHEQQIPLTVIAGFLGAGKTSWLNARIAAGDVGDALILVNDVGAVNVDVASIEYRDDRVVALSNGCLCCSLGGTLAEQLSQALRIKERPAEIIIEASGVADPARIADIARLAPGLRLEEVVVLVDASQATRFAADSLVGSLWQVQLAAAQRLLVNRLPPEGRSREDLLCWLGERAPDARLEILPLSVHAGEMESCGEMESRASELKNSVMADAPAFTPRRPGSGTDAVSTISAGPHGLAHESVSFTQAIDTSVVESLLHEHRDVLLRAKGFIRCRDDGQKGMECWRSLQLSGGRLVWRPQVTPASRSALVCIGRGGERFAGLVRCLEALGGHALGR
ncbi:CobW family GTP-binding protein [Halomonas binhaiensis]|uniref:CobW/HypB/UreG nucleotide-binding domain-containing protein n=1 Tax=Halomonas binhaiensis TaxID=2562282 RepID=A0A856QMQ3_9GAMM|nr:GTP-binding protein [Halomonas binhaiensis]QEM81205.2 hypothetical protein E4T21_06390 [Halomonas binhaiensis]